LLDGGKPSLTARWRKSIERKDSLPTFAIPFR
jgi:hypothetical protein